MAREILVPIDGSNNAEAALEVAADIAAKTEAPLKLLHIGLREPGPMAARVEAEEQAFADALEAGRWRSDYPEWPRHLQLLEYLGQTLLAEAKARAEARGAAEVSTALDWGEAGERILDHAKHPPCAMIVMGSRGASALEGAFMGSVSHKVFHHAPCSCVTVHAREDRTGLGQLERLLVPYDGSGHAAKALELAADLAGKFGARLKLLHVLDRGTPPRVLRAAVDPERLDEETLRALDQAESEGAVAPSLGGLWPMLPDQALQKIGTEVLAGAERDLAGKGLGEVETVLLFGDPARQILVTAEADGADLIVMGMRGLGELQGLLLGSVSYKVNHLAPCSCITVR